MNNQRTSSKGVVLTSGWLLVLIGLAVLGFGVYLVFFDNQSSYYLFGVGIAILFLGLIVLTMLGRTRNQV